MRFSILCVLAVVVSATLAGAQAGVPRPTLADVLARAAKAADAYADPSRVIYCDERYKPVRYRQKYNLERVEQEMLEAQRWDAEIAIAATPTLEHLGFPWWEFRDIVSLNGQPQHGGASRLGGLLESPAESLILEFNGMKGRPDAFGSPPYERTVMIPRIAALYLHAASQARYTFKDSTRFLDETVRKLTFKARKKPTLLESPVGLLHMPTSGTLWVDRQTGALHKAYLRVEDVGGRRRNDWMTITYGADGATGLWLPVSMEHQAEGYDVTVEGTAEYKNCRVVPRTPR